MQDCINIANRVYAPLDGFLHLEDYTSVLNSMRMRNGAVWSIPFILDITKEQYEKIKNKSEIELQEPVFKSRVLLSNISSYKINKEEYAEKVFGTTRKEHPGVAELFETGEYALGGKVEIIENNNILYPEYNLTPQKTKQEFKKRKWQTIVAFQTRNIPHRGHEYLQTKALEEADGLFIQPVIGKKKIADFKDEYIISSYELLIDKYLPKARTMLGILPIKMRYAGPREAILHALIRKNYGCTHFIVGRDHAGVGNFYKPSEAQEIFNNFKQEELGIKILLYKEVVYSKKKKNHYFIDEIEESDRIYFSGTKIRDAIVKSKDVPHFLIRKEINEHLQNAKNSFVDSMYKNSEKLNKGFVLWLTGLSAAGKTTIADKVFAILKEKDIVAERLDGDIARNHLTNDLGFSREDRDENIKRVGFVSGLLSKNGVAVVASFITPYVHQRDSLRRDVHNYIEVFIDAPLSVCEQRDPKGLYKKARAGEIKLFTGIDDPYHKPKDPDLHICTHENTIDESVKKIINYLEKEKII